jgi:hypothetical protein
MKAWLITASALVAVGLLLFAGVMTAYGWDFTALSTSKYQTNVHPIQDEFSNITIDTNAADIRFEVTDDMSCRVVCHEQEQVFHQVTVENDTLRIELQDQRKWYEHIGFGFEKTQITLYIPGNADYGRLHIQGSTGDVQIPGGVGDFETVDITLSTGDIRLEDLCAGEMELSASTGKVTCRSIFCDGELKINVGTGKTLLETVDCGDFSSRGSTGDIVMEEVYAKGDISIHRSTGDVTFSQCDAGGLYVTTGTGNVRGSLKSEKRILAQSDTGKVQVPRSETGGRCEITTDTGDIHIVYD